MSTPINLSERTLAIQRLTALWALNECGLGGILHAFNSPFTGLLVGSIAMVCIAMICSLTSNKWSTIMTSLMIVLVVKALVSPHSSPTAYIAVVFQAITGAMIYRFIPHLLVASLLFFTLGLVESAAQRLITLTVLYGNTLWEAIDIWGQWIVDRWRIVLPFSSSAIVIFAYGMLHVIVGLLMGGYCFKIIRSVHSLWGDPRYRLVLSDEERKEFVPGRKGKKRKHRKWILLAILVMVIILAYSGLGGENSHLEKALLAVVRAAVILTLWFVFIAPVVIRWLKRFLMKRRQQLAREVEQTMDMFPRLLFILDKARKETRDKKWFPRWHAFVSLSLLYILQFRIQYDQDTYGAGA